VVDLDAARRSDRGVREVLADYVQLQRVCLAAHDDLAVATGRHPELQAVREDLAKDRRLLEENLTAACAELDQLGRAQPPTR
jgi:hypothetical protein